MTLVLRSIYIETVRRVRVPIRLSARTVEALPVVTDEHRYRSIGSLHALALAAAASVATTALMWLAL